MPDYKFFWLLRLYISSMLTYCWSGRKLFGVRAKVRATCRVRVKVRARARARVRVGPRG